MDEAVIGLVLLETAETHSSILAEIVVVPLGEGLSDEFVFVIAVQVIVIFGPSVAELRRQSAFLIHLDLESLWL